MDAARLPQPLSLDGNVSENFKRFKQAFEIYLVAAEKDNKKDEIKIALLLNSIGEEAVQIYNNFKLSDEEKKRYNKVMEEFEKYFNPKANVVYERFKFYKKKQLEGEPFDNFLQELRKLVKTCNFTDADEMVRDRVVLGIYDKGLQEKLLSQEELTMERSMEICRAFEATKTRCKDVQESVDKKVEVVRKKFGFQKKNDEKHTNKNKDVFRKEEFKCKRCLKRHKYKECPAYGKVCNNCKKYNHFTIACKAKSVYTVKTDIEGSEEEYTVGLVKIGQVRQKGERKEWIETIEVENNPVEFKIDTGAEVNILPKEGIKSWKKQKMEKTGIILEAYGGKKYKPIGIVNMNCRFKHIVKNISFVIVDIKSKPTLGLEACELFELVKLASINIIDEIKSKEMFVKTYPKLFEGLGRIKSKVGFKINPEVPKNKLDELCKREIIQEVEENNCDWVSNLVIVEKPDGTIRLCIDPMDLNKAIVREHFLIPTLDEITAKLSGKNIYTVLDFKDGYYQLELNDECSNVCAFNTPYGTYKFKRLPFGLACAPEIFQKINYKLFGQIEGVVVYFDDLLIMAENEKEHDEILNKVMKIATENEIKFNKNKIQFKQTNVKYLGHHFNKDGMSIDKDASQDGLGCVLLQEKKPVAFASRALTEAERKYPQIEKEFLAIVFACIKFHQYIYGRQVEVISDHKPLEVIINQNIDKIKSIRIQRLRLKLLKYSITVKYVPGKELLIADYLSRNYLKHKGKEELDEVKNIVHRIIHNISISDERKELIRQVIKDEKTLKQVKSFNRFGWPKEQKQFSTELQQYFAIDYT
nr:uncharacterized protein K02A2.6-like [Onthophagus taurus]